MGDEDTGVNLFADQAAQYEVLNAAGYTPQEAALAGGWGLMPPSTYTQGDASEAARVDGGMPKPAGSEGLAFWQRFAMFGAGRILDNAANAYIAVNGNTGNGSFAGQNGRSYAISNGQLVGPSPTQQSRQPARQPARQPQNGTALIAMAAIVYFALS